MSQFDLIIRGGRIVTATEVRLSDIGIVHEKMELLEPGTSLPARDTVDATGLHIFPGLIDSHVHFNEPGRADWEGFETGSQAMAAGGGTLFFDMPLNAHPPTLDADSFDRKHAAASSASLVDFAFWGGLVPSNLNHLEELAERGVVGFKAFMSNSGIEDFPRVDDKMLREGMKIAASLHKLVAVHAESESITSDLAAQFISEGKNSARHYLDSRPIHAELDAIERVIEIAADTKCALHIVHVSCGAGVVLVSSAQRHGVDVTCETCPHYLSMTEVDTLELGAIAKCAPPLREKPAQDALWQYLMTSCITSVGSDHSPSLPAMKMGQDFFKVWGGISGVQQTLPLLITEGHIARQMPLAQIASLTAKNVAKRFRLPEGKGELRNQADADLVLVDVGKEFEQTSNELFYRHKQSPYVGRRLTGKVVQTILRGRTVFERGKIVSKPIGRLVRPTK